MFYSVDKQPPKTNNQVCAADGGPGKSADGGGLFTLQSGVPGVVSVFSGTSRDWY